jgi:hypothetical protein
MVGSPAKTFDTTFAHAVPSGPFRGLMGREVEMRRGYRFGNLAQAEVHSVLSGGPHVGCYVVIQPLTLRGL